MYLLALFALIGSAIAVPLVPAAETRNTNELLAEQYVLPGETIPTFYDVSLFLDPNNPAYFTGSVSIRILPQIETNEIVMHAMEMQITRVEVYSERGSENIFQNFVRYDNDTHFLKITVSEQMAVLTPYTVNIDYVGQYAENMFGIYVSTYTEAGNTVSLVTSQLQPTFARRAFPCYDEPHLKAIFRTTIYAPPAFPVVRSNMPLRNDLLKPEVTGYNKFEFQDTLVMSTYLLGYLVSNFDYLTNENTANPIYNIPFRVYFRPGVENTAEFAMDFGQRNMVALENYVEFDFAFPKMDHVAVPDFAAGAMENWGIVIYREVALLVQDGVTTTATKQNIGRIICHENVHQWFGNEVGPLSWTFTWLNEGYANFFENFATDLVLPEWRMMDQFVIALQNVMQSDAVLSVNSMTHPVYTPSQVLGTFNAVAYQKSGSVIRMLHHFLTPEVARRGLVIYVETMSRKAASPADLYAAYQRALDESDHSIPYPVATVMNNWVNQGGFPVLTITRNAASAHSVTIRQERFLTDRSLSSNDQWHVPLNWVLSTSGDFSDTSPQAWLPPSTIAQSFNVTGLPDAEWYIFNKQQTGYYRVNYDEQNWAALRKVLVESHQTIHLLNRAQILDDAFNLARNGRLNYDYPLAISLYLVQEKDYIPWAAVNPAYSYLDVVLSESPVYNLFQEYLLGLTAPLFSELSFHAASDEEHVTPYHRNIILDINCRYGNEQCISTAQQLLQEFRNNPTQSLNPDIQTLVFCSGLRGGDVDNFNFLWDRYMASTDSSEQAILLNSMGCTSNAERRAFYLNQVIDDDSPVRDQDRHTIIVAVTNASPENRDAALDFIIENFHLIQPRVQGLTGTTNILNAFARRLTSQAHSDKIDEFYNRHENIFTAGELGSIGFIRENIAAAITWSNENAAIVEGWLKTNYGDDDSGSAAVTSGIVILVSFILIIFNH